MRRQLRVLSVAVAMGVGVVAALPGTAVSGQWTGNPYFQNPGYIPAGNYQSQGIWVPLPPPEYNPYASPPQYDQLGRMYYPVPFEQSYEPRVPPVPPAPQPNNPISTQADFGDSSQQTSMAPSAESSSASVAEPSQATSVVSEKAAADNTQVMDELEQSTAVDNTQVLDEPEQSTVVDDAQAAGRSEQSAAVESPSILETVKDKILSMMPWVNDSDSEESTEVVGEAEQQAAWQPMSSGTAVIEDKASEDALDTVEEDIILSVMPWISGDSPVVSPKDAGQVTGWQPMSSEMTVVENKASVEPLDKVDEDSVLSMMPWVSGDSPVVSPEGAGQVVGWQPMSSEMAVVENKATEEPLDKVDEDSVLSMMPWVSEDGSAVSPEGTEQVAGWQPMSSETAVVENKATEEPLDKVDEDSVLSMMPWVSGDSPVVYSGDAGQAAGWQPMPRETVAIEDAPPERSIEVVGPKPNEVMPEMEGEAQGNESAESAQGLLEGDSMEPGASQQASLQTIDSNVPQGNTAGEAINGEQSIERSREIQEPTTEQSTIATTESTASEANSTAIMQSQGLLGPQAVINYKDVVPGPWGDRGTQAGTEHANATGAHIPPPVPGPYISHGLR